MKQEKMYNVLQLFCISNDVDNRGECLKIVQKYAIFIWDYAKRLLGYRNNFGILHVIRCLLLLQKIRAPACIAVYMTQWNCFEKLYCFRRVEIGQPTASLSQKSDLKTY